MRARLHEALSVEWNGEAIFNKPEGPRPGKNRRHVFDFEHGVRLIMSIDFWKGKGRWLHLSWSLHPHAPKELRSLPAFDAECDRIAALLWPDTVLIELERAATTKAFHRLYEVPFDWQISNGNN